MTELATQSDRFRLDLHNSHCNHVAAQAGYCGETHLATGRVCHLPARHSGPCRFDQSDSGPAVAMLSDPALERSVTI